MQKGSAARKSFPDVDPLVFGIKKNFKKSPRRNQKFREICSDVPLPPEPVSTRWTTWLKAVHYLNNHHEQMLRVISTFNPDELAVIEKCQKLLINPTVVQQFQCIDRNHSFLIDSILQLEGNLSLWDSLKLLDIVCEKWSDPVSKAKFDENMAKKPGLKIYCHADGKVLLRTKLQKCCFALVTLIFSNFAYKVLQNSMFESTYFLTYSTYFRHILYYIFQNFKHILLSAPLGASCLLENSLNNQSFL